MAVENKIVTGNIESKAADVGIAARFTGGTLKAIPFSFEVAAADSAGSIHRFARISPRAIVVGLKLLSDATAGATEVDFGFYKPLEVGGAVVDIDALVDGADISAGKAALTEMFVPAIDALGKNAHELAGITEAAAVAYGSFDVAMTAVSDISAAGTISGILYFIDGN
jgi:hypothetical protein